jgi:predicted transcriptional regulator of viral defense system
VRLVAVDESLLYAIASRNGGIVSVLDCRRAGYRFTDITAKCRSGEWSHLARGSYLVNADVRGGPTRAEMVRAAIASFGLNAVVGLQTAAELHGIGGAPPSSRTHVITPRRLGRGVRILDPSIRCHQIDLADEDMTVIDGIAVTTAARTLMDLACSLDRFGAVAVADSCLNRGFVAEDELAALSARVRGRRGAVIARQAFAEADGRAESPLETRVRLRAADGKVAPDQLQYVVRRSDGSIVARCDFAWTRNDVIGEADGVDPHSTPDALFYDRERQNALLAMGFHVVRFTWPDTLLPETVPRMIRAALLGPDRRS